MLLLAACGAGGLDGFPREEILVSGQPWPVAVADDTTRRAQGLMGVESLGSLRGMLFVFPEDTTSGFWMKDTILPLDIAFFAADGSLVGVLSMVPCSGEECPTYRSTGPYRYALEVPAGGFDGLDDLRLDPASVGD